MWAFPDYLRHHAVMLNTYNPDFRDNCVVGQVKIMLQLEIQLSQFSPPCCLMGKRRKGEFITIPAATFARAPHVEIDPRYSTSHFWLLCHSFNSKWTKITCWIYIRTNLNNSYKKLSSLQVLWSFKSHHKIWQIKTSRNLPPDQHRREGFHLVQFPTTASHRCS